MSDPETCVALAPLADSIALSFSLLPVVVTTCVVTAEAIHTLTCWPRWTRPFVEEPPPPPSLVNVEGDKRRSRPKNVVFFLLVVGLVVCIATRLYMCWNVLAAVSILPWVLKLPKSNHLKPPD